MNIKTLIISPKWNITAQPGCCGIATISRLSSRYCSRTAKDSNLQSWYESDNPDALMSDLPKWVEQDMVSIFKYSNQRPQGVQWHGRQGFAGWYGNAVPVKLGFIAVLEQMSRHHKHALYFLSDNTDQRGDVHTGPFSTLRFVYWLVNTNLGSVVTSGPITSLRTHRNIQGWIFIPNWSLIDHTIVAGRGELILSIKGLNNDPRIKKAYQNRTEQQNRKRQNLRQSLSSHW